MSKIREILEKCYCYHPLTKQEEFDPNEAEQQLKDLVPSEGEIAQAICDFENEQDRIYRRSGLKPEYTFLDTAKAIHKLIMDKMFKEVTNE